jgi:hypothetical protein
MNNLSQFSYYDDTCTGTIEQAHVGSDKRMWDPG